MPNFDDFLMRHGIGVVQWLVEQIERKEGIAVDAGLSIEERWAALMCGAQQVPCVA